MQEKIWEYRNKQLEKEDIESFAVAMKIPPAMAVILMNRGIFSKREVGAFMKKSLENVHNPFMLDGMEEATERILSAVDTKEKIVVYGDYDVDGITATATVYKFLKSIGAEVSYYIPDRFSEGYGINILAINKMARAGVKLLVSVDCGIASIGEVEFAKTQGMDVVITDHHTCREELPKAVAVINPKRQDSSYPFDGLAGVGVAFKLVLALAVRLGMKTKDVFAEYVELAAIGTIADVMPLTDENRIIVDKGIKAVQNTQNNGIRALLASAGAGDKPLDAMSLAFIVAPRLNAAGRMEDAKIAVELLICEDYERATEIAGHLSELNKRRQEIEKTIFDEAWEQVQSFGEEQLVYVIKGEGWHHGVIGIVASRICERLYRPCILISCENGKGKGSGRSVEEMNLFDAVSDSEEILTAFGGHAQAAGISINEDKIDELRKRINVFAKNNINKEQLVPKIKIDCNLSPASISMNSAKMLELLEPFGAGNETPVFSAKDFKVLASECMGADGKHLKMRLSGGGQIFNAVGFGMGEYCGEFGQGDTVSIAFNMSVNAYRGSESLQLILKDIKK